MAPFFQLAVRRYVVAQSFQGAKTPQFAAFLAAVRRAQEQWPQPAGTWNGDAPSWVVPPSYLEAAPEFLASVRAMSRSLCRRQTKALQAVMDRAEQLAGP
ncbi:unnamed protein product [Symbiodinium natans]|uniref:Uncharacterized protein n=1 Tax=Symbiodinium natans TaxID=878477 RepID=A0A812MJN2_9DINO|nr:unnamed protein product [Symbiodinium natans]